MIALLFHSSIVRLMIESVPNPHTEMLCFFYLISARFVPCPIACTAMLPLCPYLFYDGCLSPTNAIPI